MKVKIKGSILTIKIKYLILIIGLQPYPRKKFWYSSYATSNTVIVSQVDFLWFFTVGYLYARRIKNVAL